MGHLGAAPEVKETSNNSAMVTISIATNRRIQNKQDKTYTDEVEWTPVVFFGKVAEIAADRLKKGSRCYIEGRKQTRKWTDKEGIDRYTTEVVVAGYEGVFIPLDDREPSKKKLDDLLDEDIPV